MDDVNRTSTLENLYHESLSNPVNTDSMLKSAALCYHAYLDITVAGVLKAFEREERLRLAKERQAGEKQRKLKEIKEASEKAQEFRRKQEEERRKKVEDIRKRDEVHRATVEERRKKLLQEQNVSTSVFFLFVVVE
jgi:ATPase subunit of ABC transporter with duplicated ATPase domains